METVKLWIVVEHAKVVAILSGREAVQRYFKEARDGLMEMNSGIKFNIEAGKTAMRMTLSMGGQKLLEVGAILREVKTDLDVPFWDSDGSDDD